MDSSRTKRSISQIIFNNTPNSLVSIEEANVFAKINEIKGELDDRVNKKLLYKQLTRFVDKWREDSKGRIKGYETYIDPNSILPIAPTKGVTWEIFPLTFECINKQCNITLTKENTSEFTGSCPRCNSGLKQMRHVWIHSCGALVSFRPLDQITCKTPGHGRKYLYFHDTGSYITATWRCRLCPTFQHATLMMPCSDSLCMQFRKDPEKKLDDEEYPKYRASVWNDPWVHFTQYISFVNLANKDIKPIVESNIKYELLEGALSSTIPAGQGMLVKRSEDYEISATCSNCKTSISPTDEFCKKCGVRQENNLKESGNNGYGKQILESLFENNLDLENSDIVIYACLRDLASTISLKDEREKLQRQNIDKSLTYDLALKSFNNFGVSDVMVIEDFPLAYAAIGYSRFRKKPSVWLRAFPANSLNTDKIPLYTYCIETEAWMIQLSAQYIIRWLLINNLIPSSIKEKEAIETFDEKKARLWLTELMTNPNKDEDKKNLSQTIKALIHSLSHNFLVALASQSGIDIASFGEILLPEVFSFISYVGESDLGGLSAAFHQNLSSITDLVTDQLRICKFDPSCTDDDKGACVGCLQLPRGCIEFNSNLSRAYLFGGIPTKSSENKITVGYLDLGNI